MLAIPFYERQRNALKAVYVVLIWLLAWGDEFLVVVYNPKSEQSLLALLQKIESAICTAPVIYGQDFIKLHVSMGYAMFEPGMTSPEQMLKIADERMYQHKHGKHQAAKAKLG